MHPRNSSRAGDSTIPDLTPDQDQGPAPGQILVQDNHDKIQIFNRIANIEINPQYLLLP